jgi:hypothetical protein
MDAMTSFLVCVAAVVVLAYLAYLAAQRWL